MEESKCEPSFLVNQNNDIRQCLYLLNKEKVKLVCKTQISGSTMVIKKSNKIIYIEFIPNGSMKICCIEDSIIKKKEQLENYTEIVREIVSWLV
jgi:hypothetical protein